MTKRITLSLCSLLLVAAAIFSLTPALDGQSTAPVGVEARAQLDVARAAQPSGELKWRPVSEGTGTTITLDNWVTIEHRSASGELLGKWRKHNLTPNGGKDFIKAQISGTATTSNCVFVGVDDTAYTPAAGDSALPSEMTTNGFARASGSYASTGTGTWTLTKVFTASGSFTNIQAAAVFLDATVGSDTMCFGVGSLGPVSGTTNDTVTVTWSGTVS
jgi:hypothetical protein